MHDRFSCGTSVLERDAPGRFAGCWLVPCEILVEKLGGHEEVAGCRHGSQRLSRRLRHG